MKEESIDIIYIRDCRFGKIYPKNDWHYEIMLLVDKLVYRADLYGPDYDDFDWRYKDVELQHSSPEFSTKEEVIAYAEKEWGKRDRELVAKTQKIDNCRLAASNSTHGWQYKIMLIADKLIYRADLYGPDYVGLDWKYNKDAVLKSSPEFDTEEKAIAYAEREWVDKKE